MTHDHGQSRDGATAVVVGAGIGGLCAAVGLRRRGWDVTVLERAPGFAQVGAGLTILANGLRGLDALGLGDAVRAHGSPEASGGMRTPDGRWVMRVDAAALTRALGTSAVGIHRATLHGVLVAALPASVVGYSRATLDPNTGDDTETTQVALDEGEAQIVRLDVSPGVYGLKWTWD